MLRKCFVVMSVSPLGLISVPSPRGKIVLSDDIPLSDDCSIHVLGVGETYKYLGFHEAEGLDCAKSKDLLINSYYHRLKLVWNSLLSRPRKTRATNSFCAPFCPMVLELFHGLSQKLNNFMSTLGRF